MSKLKRTLGLMDVFAVAAGAMISSGLFILPAIAYANTGPAIIFSYTVASILMIPSALSQAELATAMPRAGGTYFYIERSLGAMWGLFSGCAGWFSLALKSAFAVVGMAVFVDILLEHLTGTHLTSLQHKEIAVICCVGFSILNILSVKHTGRFQIILVFTLIAVLLIFIALGIGHVDVTKLSPFAPMGWPSVFATAGLVFISYGGLTKVASIAEEVHHPSKNLPTGMMLAWCVVSLLYVAAVFVTVGTVQGQPLADSLTPLSLSASTFMGTAGFVFLGIAAAAAFITTANGGILAASRSPLAMSRDHLLPSGLARINQRFRTPHVSIILTSLFMIIAIVTLDLENLVKVASTLMLILLVLVNASVIIMRESRIGSYRPKFKSPFYPYGQIAAIIAYIALLCTMGLVPLLICVIFFGVSLGWYLIYVRQRVKRASAMMHVVERVTDKELKTVTLENELRDILLERDNIVEDRFDKLIRQCEILDVPASPEFETFFRQVADRLSKRLDISEYVLFEKFLQREAEGGTVVQPGFAIPHIVIEGKNKFDVMLIRAEKGIKFPHAKEPIRIVFVLAGSKDERNYHLRALMAIAQIAQEKDFEKRWFEARDIEGLRNIILLSNRLRDTNSRPHS